MTLSAALMAAIGHYVKVVVWHLIFIVWLWSAMLFLDVPTGLKWWQVIGGGTCLGMCNVIYARYLR